MVHSESLPAGKPLKVFHNWLNYQLFSATSDRRGTHRHPRLALSGGEQRRPFGSGHRPAGGPSAVSGICTPLEKMITATGRRFLFTVAPGKAAIYPEYVGSGASAAGSPVYKALLDAHARYPLAGFIRLEPALKKAKLNGIDVYHKQSRLWSCEACGRRRRTDPGRS
jgi:hypothetical protein